MANGESASSLSSIPTTPLWWRIVIFSGVVLLGGAAYALRQSLGLQLISGIGVICLIGLAACFSNNLRAVNWRTIIFGIILQLILALFILKFAVNDFRPGYYLFEQAGNGVKKFNDFTQEGATFVFGPLADREKMIGPFDVNDATIVAFQALTPIIFISAFFTVLYYFGVLQFIVRVTARLMMHLMRTSGAETLSATANVFMGQTEAPLIVKPYIARMTQSELLTMMTGGMATISGALLATYAQFGADRVALLATSVMAAPCGLYLSKLILPETAITETGGVLKIGEEKSYVNVIDAAASGASDGMRLAINVVAMLIAFLAILAMINFLLGQLATGQTLLTTFEHSTPVMMLVNAVLVVGAFCVFCLLLNQILVRFGPKRPLHKSFDGHGAGMLLNAFLVVVVFVVFVGVLNYLLLWLPPHFELKHIFAFVFSPLAFLMGVPEQDIPAVANLLGTKIAANEFVAFLSMNAPTPPSLDRPDVVAGIVGLSGSPFGQGPMLASAAVTPVPLSPRSVALSSYALTGFANFGSVGIQIGGIGALAPERRADLARLGVVALMVGFLVTCINAALAGMLISFE